MDIRKLTKDELLLLAGELGVEVNQKMRKPEIRCAIQEIDFEEDEIEEAWDKICRIEKEKAEARERVELREQRQAELELEREQRKIELELERLKLEQARLASGASVAAAQSDNAAQLADEYVASRGFKEPNIASQGYRKLQVGQQQHSKVQRDVRDREGRKELYSPHPSAQVGKAQEFRKSSSETDELEKRRPIICYVCKGEGHFARNCRKERPVFATVSNHPGNHELLAPYTKDLAVNGRTCKVLRDSAATMDVVHPKYVSSEDYVSECAWIRQAWKQPRRRTSSGGRSLLREHGLARFSPQVAEHQAPCRRIVVPRSCLRRWPSQVTLRGRNAHRSPPANIYEPREVLPCQQRPRVSDQAFEFGPHALASWKTPAWSRDHLRRGRLRGVERGVNPGQRTREAAPEPPASSEGPGDPILDSVK
ncbi:hypothetical protein HPB50_016988 [Hyalomma asiaticum]|uniref:Uncharacterized protein n=1 Tax=Hyalomma asiaticum TaxID=266040 RepID=A0ACB7TLQ2_HYAAI|nr:hypothetical protein HPB50_016988 [Hyalomma asiaticum]